MSLNRLYFHCFAQFNGIHKQSHPQTNIFVVNQGIKINFFENVLSGISDVKCLLAREDFNLPDKKNRYNKL